MSTDVKLTGRLGACYRVMWDQNSYYNPPISPERVAQAHLGFFAGRPVDAYVGALGCNAGYTVGWATKVTNAEFWVDRLKQGAFGSSVKDIQLWRHAENFRQLWEDGHDPIGIEVAESQRIGVDHWLRLSMNDWHHWGDDSSQTNLMSSHFYDEHPEYLIGDDGITAPGGGDGWSGHLAKVLPYFQDWMHAEVRALRRDIAVEACTRYDVAGFLYDFMRCPGYFKYGREDEGRPIMTEFIRETRRAFDAIEKRRKRWLCLGVRVPATIDGCLRLGLDVSTWIEEGRVDLVIPSCFFAQDLEEDSNEWVALAQDTPVHIYPAIEEGYQAGHTSGFRRWYFDSPIMTPMTNEMIRGLAARHLQRGVQGLYVFNFFGVGVTYDYDNREAVDDIGNPIRLQHKDKTYALTRSGDSFPNCLRTEFQIPAPVTAETKTFTIDVVDDLAPVLGRLRAVELLLHLNYLTIADSVAVAVNGVDLNCANPMVPGGYEPTYDSWLRYDLLHQQLPVRGVNKIQVRRAKRNTSLDGRIDIELADVELRVMYDYPDGTCRRPPGWGPPA